MPLFAAITILHGQMARAILTENLLNIMHKISIKENMSVCNCHIKSFPTIHNMLIVYIMHRETVILDYLCHR